MKFDLILTNPPFQDTLNRGKTPHKLWIDFTKLEIEKLLVQDGYLYQVSPSSFQSPSNKVFEYFKKYQFLILDLTTGVYFPDIASSFSHYLIRKRPSAEFRTEVRVDKGTEKFSFNREMDYLPNDLCEISFAIHCKVIFGNTRPRLGVRWDYVTCHNILIHKSDSLSKTQTEKHKFPVLHTNRQTWWSSIRQDWAGEKKVMWSRSGYFQPFYDAGVLGGTDMVYFVVVKSERAGRNLEANLNSKLVKYLMKTAKWSGFGNEKVFAKIPLLPNRKMTEREIRDFFELSEEECKYIDEYLE